MTQKNKDLLLKDLCARLPYGVKVKIKHYDDAWELLAIYTNGTTYASRDVGYPIETYFEDCKPFLFPLSSMTEEQLPYYITTLNIVKKQEKWLKHQIHLIGLTKTISTIEVLFLWDWQLMPQEKVFTNLN